MPANNREIISELKNGIRQGFSLRRTGVFIPTGLQDDIILSIGNMVSAKGEAWDHYHVQSFNNLGKTCLWTNITRELAAPSGNKYFDLPFFRKWNSNWPTAIAVITTKENLKEGGAVEVERRKWWPEDQHDGGEAQGQHYTSFFRWKSGWTVKLYSNEQAANQMEGWEVGLWIMDEPARPGVVSAMNTRLKSGGVGMTIFTPITLPGGFNPGPVLDVLEDLEGRGRKIKWLNYNRIEDNDKEDGRPNRLGEKRGLYTKEEIRKFSSGVSSIEVDARLHGLCNVKSGRVYPIFNRAVHVQDIELLHPMVKTWQTFMGMDPHPKYYPFMLWVARAADGTFIIYNEWPQFDTFRTDARAGEFYSVIRQHEICYKTVPELAQIIKLCDMGNYISVPRRRAIDPLFATQSEGWQGAQGVVLKFANEKIIFTLPPVQRIGEQQKHIADLLNYDTASMAISGNRPRLIILPHCLNTIRSFERHYWEDGKEKEAEDYKDPVDVLRYILALIGSYKYEHPEERPAKRDTAQIRPGVPDEYAGMVRSIWDDKR